jgi:hypothetical protein
MKHVESYAVLRVERYCKLNQVESIESWNYLLQQDLIFSFIGGWYYNSLPKMIKCSNNQVIRTQIIIDNQMI